MNKQFFRLITQSQNITMRILKEEQKIDLIENVSVKIFNKVTTLEIIIYYNVIQCNADIYIVLIRCLNIIKLN